MKRLLLASIVFSAALGGCDSTLRPPDALEEPQVRSFTNDAGQTVTAVHTDDLRLWLEANDHLRIVAIAGRAGELTREFLVVTEPVAALEATP